MAMTSPEEPQKQTNVTSFRQRFREQPRVYYIYSSTATVVLRKMRDQHNKTAIVTPD